jgi:four helix bundle protein
LDILVALPPNPWDLSQCGESKVAGAARSSLPEYIRFLEIAYGSAIEVEYQLLIAERLDYGQSATMHSLSDQGSEMAMVLHGSIRLLRGNL